ncbi:hypothetical protein AHAS_Ahas06G0003100 [Arachis hypogaea]
MARTTPLPPRSQNRRSFLSTDANLPPPLSYSSFLPPAFYIYLTVPAFEFGCIKLRCTLSNLRHLK